MSKLTALVLALSVWMLPQQLLAADFDGSVPLLCAAIQIVECEVTGDCHRRSAESVNIPQFVKIDFEEKTISGNEADGKKKVAAIKNSQRIDGRMIMQGLGDGRGWTIVISEETGKMSVAVSDDQVGFVIFGACTAI